MISGFLEKGTKIVDWQFFKKLCYCLLFPYLLYNLPYLPLFFTDSKDFIVSFLTISVPPNDPTWFFFALFVVKLLTALFAKHSVCLLSIAAILYCVLEYLGFQLNTFFCIHAILTGLVFYEIGKIFKLKYKSKFALMSLPIAILLIGRSVVEYGRYDMYWGYIDDPVMYLLTSATCSIAVLTLCFYSVRWCSKSLINKWIYPISRGTMLIVGTHYMLAHFANKMLFATHDSLVAKWCYTLCLLCFYYIVIELTFQKYPFLYGKMKR